MELNDIQKLIQTFNDTGLNRLKYTNGTESLVLEKGFAPVSAPVQSHHTVMQPMHGTPAPAVPSVEQETVPVIPAAPAVDVDMAIKAPMVGVFYPAPSPDAQAYVEVGQRVVKGQTLCILEAMKVLNEIQAEWDGVVEAILVHQEDIVEYGQPLFLIRRA